MQAKEKIAVIGSGTMGTGIAQVAATFGHSVTLIDQNKEALEKASARLVAIFKRLVEKNKFTEEQAQEVLEQIQFSDKLEEVKSSKLVIEAIVEDLAIKKQLFSNLESHVDEETILASNTSSLSIASIAAACKHAQRVIGLHFFNPAPLMPLVEIVPALTTANETLEQMEKWMETWKKVPVIAKDTPGFIVNRLARPFYGEALRIFEENIADVPTIDWAMKELGGFKMGPFELMDYIGNDVNYTVTETVFKAFYYEPRYRPSFTQKRLFEAGLLGRKTGKGYYDYSDNGPQLEAKKDKILGQKIVNRVLVMLMNEAIDALHLKIATKEHLDLAMTKGVNYPKGLLVWAEEMGLKKVWEELTALQEEYGEDRYRPSPLLRRLVKEGKNNFQD